MLAKAVEHGGCVVSPHSAIILFPIDGALNHLPKEHSAVGNRDAGGVVNITAAWEKADDDAVNIEWARAAWRDIRGFSTGGTYVNFLTEEEGDERIHAAYRDNYRRLVEIKTQWDPDNVFRINKNISAQAAPSPPPPGKNRPPIKLSSNGPYLVTVDDLTNSKGERLNGSRGVALCRCGASNGKPFCDGSHLRIGFSDERRPDRTPDGVVDYRGAAVVVHFNRLQCSASERCAKALPLVFREGQEPWIQPDQADADTVIEVIRHCPSGALRYTRHGQPGPSEVHAPSIRIARNGPYEVQGFDLAVETWSEGASRERFTLCRCGGSKNKPFCDGTHRSIKFQDDSN